MKVKKNKATYIATLLDVVLHPEELRPREEEVNISSLSFLDLPSSVYFLYLHGCR